MRRFIIATVLGLALLPYQSLTQRTLKNCFSLVPLNGVTRQIGWSAGVEYTRLLDMKNNWLLALPAYTHLNRPPFSTLSYYEYHTGYHINPGLYYRPFPTEKPEIQFAIGVSYFYYRNDFTHGKLTSDRLWNVHQTVKAIMEGNRLDFEINRRFDLGVLLSTVIWGRGDDYSETTNETRFQRYRSAPLQ